MVLSLLPLILGEESETVGAEPMMVCVTGDTCRGAAVGTVHCVFTDL